MVGFWFLSKLVLWWWWVVVEMGIWVVGFDGMSSSPAMRRWFQDHVPLRWSTILEFRCLWRRDTPLLSHHPCAKVLLLISVSFIRFFFPLFPFADCNFFLLSLFLLFAYLGFCDVFDSSISMCTYSYLIVFYVNPLLCPCLASSFRFDLWCMPLFCWIFVRGCCFFGLEWSRGRDLIKFLIHFRFISLSQSPLEARWLLWWWYDPYKMLFRKFLPIIRL